ncbi:DUF1223 domain-containing protein [Roseitranquillus sediminis]|uniref:DUF1223 domain-containing protein n=1 Tax=Roseitranquillus sediminis TaxID=2809051 RepID=UPI001D0CBB9A|nr:DUF1223 domain-containing protein [Roseitranquillus sediminis]MBM9595238.1 DUF1223 domain-containing protein [Roseitranquillus sediminis]
MRRWVIGFAAALIAAGGALRAEGPVVVELFTSQGCSSCPPADALLGRLAAREDVIPLALHVDYWDYIGWEDEFAEPEHTRRQKGYAHAAGARTIYTPQMIVGGRDHVVGHRPMEVADLIRAHRAAESPVSLSVTRAGDRVDVRAMAEAPADLRVHLVRYLPERTVEIERGENAGKTLTYHNIVTRWETIAEWDGRDPLSLSHAVPGDEPAVVLVQAARYGPILAAARLR